MHRFFLILLLSLYLPQTSLHSQNNLGAGFCLDFDGTDEVVLGNDYSSMTLPVSICLWIKPNVTGSVQSIFFSSDVSTIYQGWWFQAAANGDLNIVFGDGTGGNNSLYSRKAYTNFGVLQANRWYHLAAVIRSGNDADIYINGVSQPVSFSGGGSGLSTNNSNGVIGQNPLNTWSLNAQLDEMSIWDRSLTASEVRNLMCSKLSGNEPGLRGYYRFDAGTGNVLTDYSPNGNNGTINGATFVPSSAPVGDRSFWSHNTTGGVVGVSLNADSVQAFPGGTGDPGIHMYFVDQLPNPVPTTKSIPGSVNHYLGVFTSDYNRTFDLEYFPAPPLVTPNAYGLARRPDNTSPTWTVLSPLNNPGIILNGRSAQEQFVLISDCQPLDVLPADTVGCDSVRVTLSANFTNITWNNGSNASSRLFTQSDSVWFTATDASNGCPVSDTMRVAIVNTSNFSVLPSDTVICAGNRATLDAYLPGATNYQWSDGSSDSAATFFTPGLKWVEVFLSGSCSFRDSIRVKFSPDLEPVSEDEFFICPGQPAEPEVSQLDYINVEWSNGSTDYQTTYNGPGTFWVRAEKEDGCFENDTFIVKLAQPLDSLQLFKDTLYCIDEPFTLRAPDSLEITWPNGSDSTYRINRTQTVRVEISDGCTETVEFFKAEEITCDCNVVMPDAFTPNGDGLNDEFKPVTKCDFLTYRLRIFNRWGQLMFETTAPFEGFDGYFNGTKAPQGMYIYKFQYQTTRTEGSRQGHLMLLR